MDLNESQFIQNYKEDMIRSLLMMEPDWDPTEISDILDKEIKKKFQNPVVNIDNNFKHENQDTTLLTVMDWALDKDPIIAGNGTFYKNQHQAENPVANMLDGMLKARKATKKKMLDLKDKTSFEYKDLDLKQGNYKKNANS